MTMDSLTIFSSFFIGNATGPCFLHENNGTCSFPVTEFTTTKEICCVTVGKGWGTSCEPCATFESQCLPGFSVNEDMGRCVGEFTAFA